MKPFIVLMPGMMCNQDVFSNQINVLENFFNVIDDKLASVNK